jgi:CTD kinase subunit gamma
MQNKSFLEAQAVTQIEEVLKERDASAQDISMSSPPPHPADGDGGMPPSRTLLPNYNKRSNAPAKLDKKQIEQRIEEDRERHKRQREHIWAVPPGEDAEMEKLWDETSDLGEDDHRMGEEEWAEWKAEYEARRCVHRKEGANGTR